MTSFLIPDEALAGINDQVVIITGIGLATLRRVLKHGGKVFASDLNPLPSPENGTVPFMKVNVTSWAEQLAMFKAAEKEYGKIDHVFANAGVQPTVSLLEDDVDENGDLLPPRLDTFNVNMTGAVYTVKLGIHFLKRNPNGGSIVATASVSSFTRFPATDYTAAKHGVLGLVRALYSHLSPKLPIRINAIAPSWTDTGMMPREVLVALGEGGYQSADVVGRSVTLLMTDSARHGELIYSDRGEFRDLENGDIGYHAHTKRMVGVKPDEELSELSVFGKMVKVDNAFEEVDKGTGTAAA
ncbi:NAD(P)-binding protein [Pyrenochaeta sp. DS3sAY3a]|nr:NAD(P)-binding protein [Pyrenochaeta sp. DS3sAY3a]